MTIRELVRTCCNYGDGNILVCDDLQVDVMEEFSSLSDMDDRCEGIADWTVIHWELRSRKSLDGFPRFSLVAYV